MITILIVIAVLMLLGAIPAWPHSRNWGYGPSGGSSCYPDETSRTYPADIAISPNLRRRVT